MSNSEKLLIRAQRLCSKNEKCEYDIRKKLYHWGASDSDANEVINQLKEQGFINNQRYALSFTNDKLRFNHWGRKKIEYALRSKHIEEQYIQEAIDKIPEEVYLEILRREFEKKRKSIKTEDPVERKNKIGAYLLQKGFESGKVFELIDNRSEDDGED
jgi:regulatory protein